MISVKELTRKESIASIKLVDAKATEKLGRDFAAVLRRDGYNAEDDKLRYRFALIATPGTGKSTLMNGLYSALHQPLTIERRQDYLRQGRFGGKAITQKWFHSIEMGDVCHVDMGFGSEFWRILKPYRERLLETKGLYGVDIVEHADLDERADEFDCAIKIEKSMDADMNRFRLAYIYASAEFASRPAFQVFLSRQVLAPPAPEPLTGLEF